MGCHVIVELEQHAELKKRGGVRGVGGSCSLIENQLTRSTSSYLPHTLWQVLIRGAEAAAEYQTFIVFTPKELRY